jgi:hypothetical protein
MTTPAPAAIAYKRPIEVVDGARPMSLAQVARSIAVAVLVMLLLGSKALLNWTNDLPIGSISDFLLYVAQAWQHLMTQAALTGFAESIRNALHTFEGLR